MKTPHFQLIASVITTMQKSVKKEPDFSLVSAAWFQLNLTGHQKYRLEQGSDMRTQNVTPVLPTFELVPLK